MVKGIRLVRLKELSSSSGIGHVALVRTTVSTLRAILTILLILGCNHHGAVRATRMTHASMAHLRHTRRTTIHALIVHQARWLMHWPGIRVIRVTGRAVPILLFMLAIKRTREHWTHVSTRLHMACAGLPEHMRRIVTLLLLTRIVLRTRATRIWTISTIHCRS